MKVVPFQIPKTDKRSFLLQEDLQPVFYDKFHQHAESQLTLILEGGGTLIAGDYIGNFYASDVYLIGSNLPHVFRSESQEATQSHSLSIFFDEKTFGNFLELPECQKIKSFLQRSKSGMKPLGDTQKILAQKIQAIFEQPVFEQLVLLLDMLGVLANSEELQALSSYEIHKSFDQAKGKRMSDVINFTMQSSHRDITLEEVAQIAHLTPQAFCRYFKAHTRKTYTDFLNELRISNAGKLLMDTELSIQEISVRVGFYNISHFNRTFKKITGSTPTDYLKARKER